MSRPPEHRCRRGITLVELLVVIAIIGVLVALTVPALSGAIARGQVTQCTSNQYQLAFALQGHDERYGCIPGWLNVTATTPSTALCSWPVRLLPFLGRTDVYDMWPTLPNNPTIDLFICPSNRPDKKLTYPALHYAGNIGASGTNANDGVFLNLSSGSCGGSLDDIADADGTATTLAFTEKASLGFQPHSWTYARSSVPVGSLFGSGTALPPVFGAATLPAAPKSPKTTFVINRFPTGPKDSDRVDTRPFAPSSKHAGGVVVAFCDGHTAFLKDSLQPYEYGQLLTPRSRWPKTPTGVVKPTNSEAMLPWVLRSRQPDVPYLLDEKILKQ
jgi:prepilin-type N-terminal cleavage/methylation domain-containing protein/prepilin-type processing-associated H-X9-DG protein